VGVAIQARRINSVNATSRLARLIVPGFPHHVTQRGNRRAPDLQ